MSKVANHKAESKLHENRRTFVKNSSSFHPAEGNLSERAYLRSLGSVAEDAYEDKKVDSPEPPQPNLTVAEDPAPHSFRGDLKGLIDVAYYGSLGLIMKAGAAILPKSKQQENKGKEV